MKRVSLFVAFVSSLALFTAAPAVAEVEPVEETVIPGAGVPPADAAAVPAAQPVPADAAPSAATPSTAAPADMAPAEAAPMAQAQQPAPVRRVARAGRPGRDARHCLDLATNAEIIKCAEKYR